MCKCKKAMKYEFVISWCDADRGDCAFWLVALYATCTRCGDDNGREPIDDVTVDDNGDAQLDQAMRSLLPKGVAMHEVKVSE